MSTILNAHLDALHARLAQMPMVSLEGQSRCVLFLSASDGTKRATVVTGVGSSAQEAWAQVAARLADHFANQSKEPARPVRWLRLDWVDAVERTSWGALRGQLEKIKRNYFRLGIALDAGFEHAFLEAELNANAMLYPGPRQAGATLNEKNFAIYAARRHGLKDMTFADGDPVWLFTTGGLIVGEDGIVHPLNAGGLDTGRRTIEALTASQVEEIIGSGSRYLATQVQDDGRFHYGWHPCFDRPIGSYNTLRHASTLYAMLEAWEVTRDAQLWTAIERGLACLTVTMIQSAELPDGGQAAFLVDVGDEIKLGGNAVAILALVKHAQLSGDDRHAALLEALATGIVHMQDPATGAFAHVLDYPSLAVKEQFRIIYYDGEAAFALMRLHGHTGDGRWLAAVERAFEHFIRAEHWKAHDHWLSYCVNELTRYRPDARYYRFALDNVRDYLGFVLERITTFPTLLELMMAAQETVSRLSDDPALRHLLDGFDLSRFDKALHHRAHYLMNGYFWPELAMFFANPARIVGSFFIRHHAFRVRIDDVEHYLSGLVAYRGHLASIEAEADRAASPAPPRRHWSAADVERATGGRWAADPGAGWQARGLCTYAPTMQPEEMVAIRTSQPGVGVSRAGMSILKHRPAALIVPDDAAMADSQIPRLIVPDVGEAVLALGKYARERMRGRLVAVTGSAGKTSTVAMLSHALASYGAVGQTRYNANLPVGVAWNLASVPWDVPHTVLELAIGRMRQTTALARPDIAVFTNILPAHLEYHKDLPTVAARKSAIFEGMTRGGIAILNRDMAEWERVHMAARRRGLRIVHYGRTPDSEFRLLGYDPISREVTADLAGRTVRYPLGAAGEHMALNSVAVLAAASMLGHNLGPAIAQLSAFEVDEGRGNELAAELPGGRRVTVINDAYNANPGSMAAALAALGTRPVCGRRVVVLGEMLQLGEDGGAYHTRLAALVTRHGIDRAYVLGPLYAQFWEELPPDRQGAYLTSLDEVKEALAADLADGDTVLLKGSHDTGLFTLPRWITAQSAQSEEIPA